MNAASYRHAPLVAVERAGVVESVHCGSVAVVDPSGTLVAWAGDPEAVTFMRSSAKPFQAMALLESGAAESFGLSPEELAVACSSHSAEPEHLKAVANLLRRAGLGTERLGCGPHPPLNEEAARELARSGLNPEPIHNNCSGKHAAMLAACAHMGWPLDSYLDPGHPLQRSNLMRLSAFAGLDARPGEMQIGVDGCGAPTFALPLRAMALAFARLSDPQGLRGKLPAMAERVRQAMRAYPLLIAGSGRFDTALMETSGARMVCKAGAEGLHCLALPLIGLGVALKVADGAARAVAPAVLAVLRELEVVGKSEVERLSGFAQPTVTNTRGDVVGRLSPLVRLRYAHR